MLPGTAADGCEVSLATIYSGVVPAAWVGAPNNVAIALQDLGCALAPSDEDGERRRRRPRLPLAREPRHALGAEADPAPDALRSRARTRPSPRSSRTRSGSSCPRSRPTRSPRLDRLGYPGVAGLIRLYAELAQLVA